MNATPEEAERAGAAAGAAAVRVFAHGVRATGGGASHKAGRGRGT